MNVTTVLEEKIVLSNPSDKIPEHERRISRSSIYIGNCAIIGHRFLALSIQWTSSPPSRKWKRGVSPKFHLIVLCLV